MKVTIRNNKGFSWYSNENLFVKGYIFDTKNNFYEKEKLAEFFKNINSEDDFIKIIADINGVFSVIIKIDNKIFAASDATRFFPIFYTFNNNHLFLSDDILFLKEKFRPKLDTNSIINFKTALHTTGKTTLLKNIFQIQSSQYIIFEEDKIIKSGFFYNFSTNKTFQNSYLDLKHQAIRVLDKSFARLVNSLNGKHVALPLSGGYDSRLIAVMLKKNNYEKVTCFTYGRKNNFELENSKKTAESLGYKWVFVEYNNELTKNYINTEEFKQYAHFAGKYSSMPYMQEYFAAKYLKDNNIVPANSIVIPGHSGDLLGGSQLFKVIKNDVKSSEISIHILKKKFKNCKISQKEKNIILAKTDKLINSFDHSFKDKISYSTFENYDIKEKIAKFIFNSSSIYCFFDSEIRFPFWDKELMNFFKNVPYKYRKLKILYDDILKNNYFDEYNVNFENEIQPSKYDLIKMKIKNFIKPHLPHSIIKRRMQSYDWMFYKEITDQMHKQLKDNNIKTRRKIKSYNSIIVDWYLWFCEH